MKLLLASATTAEIQPLLHFLAAHGTEAAPGVFRYEGHTVHTCITGPGMMSATYALTRALADGTFDCALQAGVAGSFSHELAPGQVVLVQSEQCGDTGAEDRERFLDIFELGLLDADDFPFRGGRLECPLHDIPFPYRLLTVNGLTVNTVSGRDTTVQLRAERFGCQVESMEGAAFHYVCLREQVPFAQVRAVSNYVEARDRSKWKLKEAITALNEWLTVLLRQDVEMKR